MSALHGHLAPKWRYCCCFYSSLHWCRLLMQVFSFLGSAPNNHFIRSNNPAARYHTCPESSRHSVLLPYNGPQGMVLLITLIPRVFVPLDQRLGNKRHWKEQIWSPKILNCTCLAFKCMTNKLLGIYFWPIWLFLKPIKINPAVELLSRCFFKPAQ